MRDERLNGWDLPMHLLSRAGNLLRRPQTEWSIIAAEREGIAGLCMAYVPLLAAVPLGAEMIGRLGGGVPLGAAADIALSGYLLALLDVVILGLVASLLAPRFGGRRDLAKGLKLAGFGCTPAWLGGVFILVPGIGSMLALAGTCYGIYVFYLGIPALTGVPAGRRVGYLVLVLAATLALALIAALAVSGASGYWSFVEVPR